MPTRKSKIMTGQGVPDGQEPYGIFYGGPVLGVRTCVYDGPDNQQIKLVDHPGDSLFVRMEGRELIEQMGRAKHALYHIVDDVPSDTETEAQ